MSIMFVVILERKWMDSGDVSIIDFGSSSRKESWIELEVWWMVQILSSTDKSKIDAA